MFGSKCTGDGGGVRLRIGRQIAGGSGCIVVIDRFDAHLLQFVGALRQCLWMRSG